MSALSIAAVRERLADLTGDALAAEIAALAGDDRAGVRAAVESAKKREERRLAELARLEKMSEFERKYASLGPICGMDEAGRGPLAGPVVAAAVVLPEGCLIPYVNDSKQLSEKRREELYDVIMEKALSVGVGMASPERIDQINILQADYEAMREAVSKLTVRPAVFLNDAVTVPGLAGKQVAIVKGDARSISIAAASIIAKVTRDRLMKQYDELFPEYGFAGHKGYGSAQHIAKLKELGPCPIHRRSFIGHFV
ncbi:MAG: ribonuclease HII [Lachnospiraceae bacterium]|nr:ribonuclease HII [Lachnospiraceae bacterium]